MAKYNFHSAYAGPLGPHLNCLSAYTLTRRDEDRLRGESIHPRKWAYGARGVKKNTRRQLSEARKQRLIAALNSHLTRHPNDKQSETHLAAAVARAAA